MISIVSLIIVISWVLFIATVISIILDDSKLGILCIGLWGVLISIMATNSPTDINRWQYGEEYAINELNSKINNLLEKVEDKRYELQKEMKREY